MKTKLIDIVSFLIVASGLPWFIREVYARHKVTIVNYHDPSPSVFKCHMALFSRMYSFVSIDSLTQALELGDFSSLPLKPMLVTLDDGHVKNAELFEIIRSYHVPAVIYAVAGVVDTNRGFWFDRLPHNSEAMQELKSLPDAERRETLKQDYGHTDEREYETVSALSARQLRKFVELGGTVGSHTLFHPLLDQCDNVSGRRECSDSRFLLEKMLGVSVKHFALPNGNADFRVRNWASEAGYLTCRTTEGGWVLPKSDPMRLPNFGVADNAGKHKAVIQACGLWFLIKNKWRILFCK